MGGGAFGVLPEIEVEESGAYFEVAGQRRVELLGRAVLRRILAALARAAIEGAGPQVSASLIAAGWPGERIGEDSARNRLYFAVNELRKLGLRNTAELTRFAIQNGLVSV